MLFASRLGLAEARASVIPREASSYLNRAREVIDSIGGARAAAADRIGFAASRAEPRRQ